MIFLDSWKGNVLQIFHFSSKASLSGYIQRQLKSPKAEEKILKLHWSSPNLQYFFEATFWPNLPMFHTFQSFHILALNSILSLLVAIVQRVSLTGICFEIVEIHYPKDFQTERCYESNFRKKYLKILIAVTFYHSKSNGEISFRHRLYIHWL